MAAAGAKREGQPRSKRARDDGEDAAAAAAASAPEAAGNSVAPQVATAMAMHHLSVENEQLRAENAELKERKLHVVIFGGSEPLIFSGLEEAKVFMLAAAARVNSDDDDGAEIVSIDRIRALTEDAVPCSYNSNDGEGDAPESIIYTCRTIDEIPDDVARRLIVRLATR